MRLLPAFIAVLILLNALFPANISYAADKKVKYPTIDPPNSLKVTTVNLYCQFKSGKKTIGASGTGVMIDDSGVILTNAHVAQYFLIANRENSPTKSRCSVRGGSPAKELYEAEILYFPVSWLELNATKNPKASGEVDEMDFALLYVTKAKRNTIPATFPALLPDLKEPSATGTVTAAGYATEKLNFKEVERKLKLVAATSSVINTQSFGLSQRADILTIAPSGAGSHGVSGGPVLNARGELTGIITALTTGKKDRKMRAISLSYIDRMVSSATALNLTTLVNGDHATRASTTKSLISKEHIDYLAKNLFTKQN